MVHIFAGCRGTIPSAPKQEYNKERFALENENQRCRIVLPSQKMKLWEEKVKNFNKYTGLRKTTLLSG